MGRVFELPDIFLTVFCRRNENKMDEWSRVSGFFFCLQYSYFFLNRIPKIQPQSQYLWKNIVF
ncbi:hypothetical protein UZ36_00895 [Candidatus Nitromaritima sp. SCGC AAA799-C22]|nr:hypothetical protein UZ36_00895 [Candidatus Nitromaritima sp. SCGC AAA799-C22]